MAGGILTGESEDLSQGTDKRDLAAAARQPRTDLDPVDKGPNDLDRLRPSRLVFQHLLQI